MCVCIFKIINVEIILLMYFTCINIIFKYKLFFKYFDFVNIFLNCINIKKLKDEFYILNICVCYGKYFSSPKEAEKVLKSAQHLRAFNFLVLFKRHPWLCFKNPETQTPIWRSYNMILNHMYDFYDFKSPNNEQPC